MIFSVEIVTMSEFYNFVLKDLDLTNKLILDAAVGAGIATYFWAKEIHKQKGLSKIVAVDKFLPQKTREQIEKYLGQYSKYVEFKEANIYNLDFLHNDTIDIINCDNTIVFLESKPLKVLYAFKEFYRVLKPGGILIITSNMPIENHMNSANEGNWRVRVFTRALYTLKGTTWLAEPLLPEVKFALKIIGLTVYEEKIFPAKKSYVYSGYLKTWKKEVMTLINSIPWSGHLKDCLKEELLKILDKISKDGYLMYPEHYVLKSKKPLLKEG